MCREVSRSWKGIHSRRSTKVQGTGRQIDLIRSRRWIESGSDIVADSSRERAKARARDSPFFSVMPTHRVVTMDELTQYLHLPEKAVAKQLGICLTSLKKLCRQHGITRWPYRKVRDRTLPSSLASFANFSSYAIDVCHEFILQSWAQHQTDPDQLAVGARVQVVRICSFPLSFQCSFRPRRLQLPPPVLDFTFTCLILCFHVYM